VPTLSRTAWRCLLAVFTFITASVLLSPAPANAAAGDPDLRDKHYVLSTTGYPVSEQFEVTGGTGPLTFSVHSVLSLPPGLSIDDTGLVTGTPTRIGAWPVRLEVTDAEGRSDSSALVWEVQAPLTIVGLRDVISFVDRPLDKQIEYLNPEGVPVTFSAAGLPAGLQLDESTGRITGRPTVAGFSEVLVTLFGPDGHVNSRTLRWTVHATPVLTNPGDQVTVVGQPVRLALEVQHNGNPLSFSSFTLPYGLEINEETGVITGTSPWAAETDTVTVSVRDTLTGARSEISFSWRVDEAPSGSSGR
jgi:hypothetical protein